MTEGEGFEPPKALTPCWFSRLLSLIKNPCLIVVSEHECIQKVFKNVFNSGGRGGIRTHEGFNSLLVFKTSTFNQTLSPFHDHLTRRSHCSVKIIHFRDSVLFQYMTITIQSNAYSGMPCKR